MTKKPDEVMRLVQCLESADISWCAIGGVAVNHWAREPMVTANVDFTVRAEEIDRTETALVGASFASQRPGRHCPAGGKPPRIMAYPTERVTGIGGSASVSGAEFIQVLALDPPLRKWPNHSRRTPARLAFGKDGHAVARIDQTIVR